MTTPNAYTLASVKLGTGVNAKVLQVLDGSVSMNVKELARSLSGGYQAKFRGVMAIEPRISAKTTNLADFLTVVGITPKVLACVLGFVDYAADGTRGNSGYLATAATALVIPRTLSVTQDNDAQIGFDIIPISADGTTSPLACATGVPELPTEAGVFTLGGGGTLSGANSLDIDFGFREHTFKSDGAIYVTRVHIDEQTPIVRQRVCDLALVDDPGAVADFTATLVKVANKGIRDSAQYSTITLTVKEGLQTVNQFTGAHPGDANAEIVIGAVIPATGSIIALVCA